MRVLAPCSVVLLALAPALALAQDAPPPNPNEEIVVTTASEADVKRLLAKHESAEAEDDAEQVAAALAAMSAHDNQEFKPLAIAGMKYRASSFDKRAARAQALELGDRSMKQINLLLAERVGAVQAAAAHVLANFPDDKAVIRSLGKAFQDKVVRKERPVAFAAVIRAYGVLHHGRVEKDVMKELSHAKHKQVARACVRYLGQLPTKDFDNVRKLCELLDSPQPAAVDDPNNPPAGYWASLWEQWSWTRRDVTWSLKQITGQTFRPEQGEHPSDSQKALAYIKEHKRELGLK